TGLGPLNATTGKYANAGVINAAVFNAMNGGAVLINYDRGELVDAAALDAALASGKVRHAAIDADLFKDAKSGKLSGPMVPYREIAKRHKGKLELLPHAAADTEHVSRVNGAKQAVDQIFNSIRFKLAANLKGDLPKGYSNAGAATVPCVGKVTGQDLSRAVVNAEQLAAIRDAAQTIAAVWGALAATTDPDRRAELIERYGSRLVLNSNRYAALMRKLGLEGPYA
ncbi:MAG: NAD(P)-dependent oxidoreductase, partial [Aestuariivirga sp.]